MTAPALQPPLTIEAGHGHARYWQDCWRFRELLYFLCWRDILVRYKQTVFGILWSVMRPLITMLVFTLVFSKIARLPSDGTIPYPLMVFAALLPWQLVANGLSESSHSLIGNEGLISKVYFPRLLLPLVPIITASFDFLISFVLFLVLMLFYGVVPGVHLLLLPVFLLMAMALATGAGVLVSALNVSFRDFRYIIPFMIQFGLYVSPVGFSSAIIGSQWRALFSLNPMVGIIDGFRWCLLGGQTPFYWPGFVLSLTVIAVLLWLGVHVFRSMERQFADKI